MNQQNEKPDNTGESRNSDGTFKKGISGNPEGKPKGSLSLISMLKKKLEEIEPSNKKTYAELLIQRIVDLAILDKDDSQIRNILQYIEGMPKQAIDMKHEGKLTLEEFLSGDDFDTNEKEINKE